MFFLVFLLFLFFLLSFFLFFLFFSSQNTQKKLDMEDKGDPSDEEEETFISRLQTNRVYQELVNSLDKIKVHDPVECVVVCKACFAAVQENKIRGRALSEFITLLQVALRNLVGKGFASYSNFTKTGAFTVTVMTTSSRYPSDILGDIPGLEIHWDQLQSGRIRY